MNRLQRWLLLRKLEYLEPDEWGELIDADIRKQLNNKQPFIKWLAGECWWSPTQRVTLEELEKVKKT